MRNIKSTVTGLAVAGLCVVGSGYLLAEDQPGAAPGQQPGTTMPGEQPSETHMHHPGAMMHQITPQTPSELNRASKLIGTDVLNQNKDKLGIVRDLIVDPKSQRVAYAWVEKSSETGNSGKYLAVPIHLLTPTADQKDLTLNADKERFYSATGYAKNQLPNMAMTASQMTFWRNITEAAGAQPQNWEGKQQQRQPQQQQPQQQP